ncbi:hypothetical protein [Roseateles koreensis]|uniref:Uncharacterized protein n=1 Tax=Roseateles koreensis TaxID=2987526 RepID=A0ABT5KML3_9BURK|nr:hypothetical protein [Roseateles koreensis]MDC8784119.1 hypothetical protein [Roseateles koreensis]
MNRRRWLQLGLGATVLLGLAGAGVALLRPGWADGKLSPGARTLMRKVSLAVLDGLWPEGTVARESRVDQQLAQLEANIADFPAGVRDQLSQVLGLLSSGAGRLSLMGLKSDWDSATVDEVKTALQAMSVSSLDTRQQIYRALRDLNSIVFFADASNWPQTGYPGPRTLA